MGVPAVPYTNAALQATLRTSDEVLTALRDEGSLASVGHKLASFEERQHVVDKDRRNALDARYRDNSSN
jgi:2-methylisocitrate lyase-like PEP mutase family enzyme